MSYVHFSSNRYQSDVYAYEVEDGIVLHVATCRVVFLEEPPEQPPMTDVAAWHEWNRAFFEIVNQAPRVPIGLSRDGAVYHLPDEEALYTMLRSLEQEGYNVPGSTLALLRF